MRVAFPAPHRMKHGERGARGGLLKLQRGSTTLDRAYCAFKCSVYTLHRMHLIHPIPKNGSLVGCSLTRFARKLAGCCLRKYGELCSCCWGFAAVDASDPSYASNPQKVGNHKNRRMSTQL